MNRLGDQLLAGACFALDEDGCIRWCDPLQPFDKQVHLGARSNNTFKTELLVKPAVEFDIFSLEPKFFGGLFYCRTQVREIQRLLEIRISALLHGCDGRGDGAMPRNDNHLGFNRHLFGPGEDLETANIVHHQIGNDDIKGLLLDLSHSLGATASHDTLVAQSAQSLAHRTGMHDVVIHDEHAHESLRPSLRSNVGRGDVCFFGLHHAVDRTNPHGRPSSCMRSTERKRPFPLAFLQSHQSSPCAPQPREKPPDSGLDWSLPTQVARGEPRRGRQPNRYLGTTAWSAFHVDRATVGFDNLSSRWQTKARASLLRCVESPKRL